MNQNNEIIESLFQLGGTTSNYYGSLHCASLLASPSFPQMRWPSNTKLGFSDGRRFTLQGIIDVITTRGLPKGGDEGSELYLSTLVVPVEPAGIPVELEKKLIEIARLSPTVGNRWRWLNDGRCD